MHWFFLILMILGTVIPYSWFGPFLMEHGLNLSLFLEQMLANQIAGFFAWDVILSSVVFLGWVAREAIRGHVRHWWIYPVMNLTVGLSLALPAFLYARESLRPRDPGLLA